MAAIESLMEKKGKFDYILLETTGLADPGNLAPLFWMDDGLGSTIYLDGIVTLVDAKNILRSLDDPAGRVEGHEDSDDAHGPVMTTAHVQISHADVIILNKSDLVSEQELQTVRDRIESINGLARVFVTTQSAVPKLEGFLLDLYAYDRVEELDRPGLGHSHLDKVSAQICLRPSLDLCRPLTRLDHLDHLNSPPGIDRGAAVGVGCLAEVSLVGKRASRPHANRWPGIRHPPPQGPLLGRERKRKDRPGGQGDFRHLRQPVSAAQFEWLASREACHHRAPSGQL